MSTIEEKDIILVVDDQPVNLKVVSTVLSKDYTISIADSGIKALKILEKMKPSLILLDVMMPEMDGYEVIQKIKSNDELKEIPVIFLTAKNDIDDVVRGFDYGAVDYITKPFNMREISTRIKNHLGLFNAKKQIAIQNQELAEANQRLLETQEELKRRNEDLIFAHDSIEEYAYKVNQINQKLTESEAELKKSNDDLIKANREKDKFFSILAHDLRSPFTGLLGVLGLLNDDFDHLAVDDKREMIAALLQSTKNVHALIENLLEWSRVKRRVIKFDPTDIFPAHIVSSIKSVYRGQLGSKAITLNSKIPEDLSIKADNSIVNSIFRNVISNSIKFNNPNGIITVSAEVDDKGYCIFKVSDNGIGINDDIKRKLFKIDEHITSIGTFNEKGTGLGLILCKELIELHQGKIWIESELKKGTDVYFSLPLIF